MRTRLFHTIVLCGAALGAVGCSDGDPKAPKDAGLDHNCAPAAPAPVPGGGGEAGADDAVVAGGAPASGGATGSGAAPDSTAVPCGGWPPTK